MIFWKRKLPIPTVMRRSDIARLIEAVEQLAVQQRKQSEQIKQLRETFAAREKAIDNRLKMEEKWRKIFANQLSSVVRRLCLPLEQIPPPNDLTARRFRLRSQNEEDGILLALLERAGWGSRRFVEIGSGSSGGNAALLAYECGWAGLMLELSPVAAAAARRLFAGNPGVCVVEAQVTPANVNALLADNGFADEIDLLSIDIDSYDYWILHAINVCSPRILMLEYNALFGSERRVTIPLEQSLDKAPKGYAGASLAALTALAGAKGYRLVACEDSGVNAFFLRRDVAPEIPEVSPARAFKPLRSRLDLEDVEVASDIFETAASRGLLFVEV